MCGRKASGSLRYLARNGVWLVVAYTPLLGEYRVVKLGSLAIAPTRPLTKNKKKGANKRYDAEGPTGTKTFVTFKREGDVTPKG